MKKTISILFCALAALSFAVTASAQINGGIIAGVNFSSASPDEWKITKDTQYHVGGTVKVSLPVGFAIQPSLLYSVKGTNVPEKLSGISTFDYSAGYLELPVSIQWGPDLLVMRPYLEITPFVGYALNNKFKGSESQTNDWKGLNRWEYGIGAGAGIEVWHFQISARYNWNFGNFFDTKAGVENANSFAQTMKAVFGERTRFAGVTVSLAYLF